MANPIGLAVDNSSSVSAGDVYAASFSNATVSKFDASGNVLEAISNANIPLTATPFALPAAVEVNAANGDVYVADFGPSPGVLDGTLTAFGPDGTFLFQITGASGEPLNGAFLPVGVAVDPSAEAHGIPGAGPAGLVYVADRDAGTIDAFDASTGVFVSAFGSGAVTNVANLAVDSAGNVYAANQSQNVTEFVASSSFASSIVFDSPANNPQTVAIDPTDSHILVGESSGAFHVSDYSSPSDSSPVVFASGDFAADAVFGIAVDHATDRVYVADFSANLINAYGPQVTLPSVSTTLATTVLKSTATLNGTVNPEGVPVSECHFDYIDEAHYNPAAENPYTGGQSAPCTPEAGSGNAPVAVHADLSGLSQPTTYHYRLVAANTNGASNGVDETFTTKVPPTVHGENAQLTSTGAILSARVNPGFTDTTYHFQYGTSASYGTNAPVPDGDAGASGSNTTLSVTLHGLQPGSTYHYRVVAQNAVSNGPVDGPDQTFTTPSGSSSACPNATLRQGPSANLPDCRAYEQVSPAVKYGWPVFGDRLSLDGEHLIAESLGAFAGSNQTGVSFYDLVRGPGGWQTESLNRLAGYTSHYGDNLSAASPDASMGLLDYRPLSTQDERDNAFYVHELPEGAPVEVGPLISPVPLASNPPPLTLESSSPSVSADLSHVLYELSGPSYPYSSLVNYVWPGDTTVATNSITGYTSLYEYAGTGNSAPLLVGVDNEGHQISQCGTSLGYPIGGVPTAIFGGEDLYNAVSADGSRVFFTAGAACEGGQGPPAPELFARIDNGQPGAHTVAVSEPSTGPEGDCSACDTSAPANAVFQGASEDGSKVFFLTTQPLLGGDSTQNLYEYDFGAPAGQRLIRVSTGDPAGADVQGVARVSEDGSHVYFVAQGVLTSQPNGVRDVADVGQENLYVFDTNTRQLSFVATLSVEDSGLWRSYDEYRPIDATLDGRFIVFTSTADLTPDDTSSVAQVFRYDAETGGLLRVSIGRDGFNSNGNSSQYPASIVSPEYVTHFDPLPQPSSISNDGSYVVFQSADGLTPQALNGQPIGPEGQLARNVYSYHDGRISLISDGQDRSLFQGSSATRLFGVSGSGADIFFTSSDPLVSRDGDTTGDIYDARIDGGFAAPEGAGCKGEACKGSPSAPLVDQAPGSSSFSGAGNLTPAPTSGVKPKSLTRAQLLTRALRACQRKPRRKRASCRAQARKRYGAASKPRGAGRTRSSKYSKRGGSR